MSVRNKTKLRLLILVVLAVVAAAGAGGGYLLLKYRNDRNALLARDEGLKAYKEKDYEAALPKLGQYLGRFTPSDPGYLEALYDYADSRQNIEEANGSHISQAINAWKQLVELQSSNLDARLKLMQLYDVAGFRTEENAAADTILDKITKKSLKGEPIDPEMKKQALLAKAKTLIVLRDYIQAQETLDQFIAEFPNELSGRLLYLQMLDRSATEGESKAVKQTTDWLVKAPESARFQLLNALAYASANDTANAKRFVQIAAKGNLESVEAVTLAVKLLDSLKLYVEGSGSRDAYLKHPNDPQYVLAYLLRSFDAGDYKEVVALSDKAATLPALPSATGLSGSAAKSNESDQGFTRVLKAMALLQLDQKAEARAALDEVDGRKYDRAIRAFAQAVRDVWLSDSGDAVDAQQQDVDCKEALAKAPNNPYVLFLLGEAEATAEAIPLAMRHWTGAMQMAPAWPMPWSRISRQLRQMGYRADALEKAKEAMKRNSTDRDAMVAYASAQWATLALDNKEELAQLLKFLDDIEKLYPKAEEARLLRVGLLGTLAQAAPNAQEKQAGIERTREVFQACLELEPSESMLLQLATASAVWKLGLEATCYDLSEKTHRMTADLALAKAVWMMKDHEDLARTLMEDGSASHPNDRSWQNAYALYTELMYQNLNRTHEELRRTADTLEAEAIQAAAEAKKSNLEAVQIAASSARKAGDTATEKAVAARTIAELAKGKAKEAWMTTSAKFPKDLRVLRNMARSASVQDDRVLMGQVVDQIDQIAGDQDVENRIRMARRLLTTDGPGKKASEKDRAQAITILSDLTKLYPDQPEPRGMLAQCFADSGNYSGAVEQMEALCRIRPNDANSMMGLAELLVDKGDRDKAAEELSQIAKLPADRLPPGIRNRAADLFRHLGNSQGAIEILKDLDPSKTNPLFLADLYASQNRLSDALQICEEVLDKNPTVELIAYTANLYVVDGKMDKAKATIDRMEKLEIAPSRRDVVWGDYYRGSGETKLALEKYQSAVKADPANALSWHRLIGFYLRIGNTSNAQDAPVKVNGPMLALQVLAEARKSVPDDPVISYLGKLQDKGSSPPQMNIAEVLIGDLATRQFLVSLLDNSSGSNELDRSKAARETMIKMIDVVAEDSASTDTDLDGRRNRGLQKMRQIADQNPDVLPVQTLLIQFYAAGARFDDSIKLTQRAMQTFANDPEPARLMNARLAFAGRWAEALDMAKEWQKRSLTAPYNSEVAIATAYMNLRQYQEALKPLQTYIDKIKLGSNSPNDYPAAFSVYVENLVRSGNTDDARRKITPYLDLERPNSKDKWRDFWVFELGQFAEPTAAVRLLNEADGAFPADSVRERMVYLAAAWAVLELRTGKKEAYRDKATGIFGAELAKPASKDVLDEIYRTPDNYVLQIMLHAQTLFINAKTDAAIVAMLPLLKSSAWRTYWILLSNDIPDEVSAVKWLNRLTPALSAEDTPENVRQKNELAKAWNLLSVRVSNPALVKMAAATLEPLAARLKPDQKCSPDDLSTLKLLAKYYEDLGDPRAEDILRRALKDSPKDYLLLNNLSSLIVKDGGDGKEALDYVQRAIKEQPTYPALYDTQADIYLTLLKDYPHALDSNKQSLDLDPDSDKTPKWKAMRILILASTGKPEDFATAQREFARLNNDENIQDISQQLFKRTEIVWKRALNDHPDDYLLLGNLAILIVRERGDGNEALDYVGRAIRLQPRIPNLYDTQSNIYLSLFKDTSKAFDSNKQSLDLDPANPDWKGMHILILASTGRPDDFITAQSEFTRLKADREFSKISRDLLKRLVSIGLK